MSEFDFSEEFEKIWKFWYDMQIKEQLSHQLRFKNEKPTVTAAESFDAEADAEGLREAMKGFGTDEDKIISILTRRNTDQRLKIINKYEQIHGRILVKDLESELTGAFEKVMTSLMKPLPMLLADAVNAATEGAGTDENALIEIFCTRDDESIESIKNSFKEKCNKDLKEVVCKETTSGFQKTLLSILTASRDDEAESLSEVVDELCSEEIDEDKIRRIMTNKTFPFLEKVTCEYLEKTGEDLMELIKKKCSGDCEESFLAIYQCAKDRSEFYARALRKAMEGFGTDDSALIRIIVSRCEIDLGSIKEKYSKIYEDRNLEEDIKKETSGDYENSLLALLGY